MIPFNRPKLAGDEIAHVLKAIEHGQLAGDGPFTRRCEECLQSLIGARAVLLTHSCTAALEMAAMLLDLKAGDEVILPSYTFVSTANAIAIRGATPVFVDIRADTLNLDESLVEAAINKRTKAIFAVHYAGVPCEMSALSRIAADNGLALVEDAAQALTSTIHGQSAGSFGQMAAFSFHETKNVVAGEGGCLAINDESLVRRAEVIREKGTNRKAFLRGDVDKYTWVDLGSSYIPGELVAAFLYGQLQKIDQLQEERRGYWNRYFKELDCLRSRGYRLPYVPEEVEHNAHMFYVIAPDAACQERDIGRMRDADVITPFHYVPLHSSPGGKKFGRTGSDMSVTDDLSSRLIRLPLYPGMNTDQQSVVDLVLQHFGGA